MEAIIVWIGMLYACALLLKFTLAGGLKCLYRFLFIQLIEILPSEASVNKRGSSQRQSENKKDFW